VLKNVIRGATLAEWERVAVHKTEIDLDIIDLTAAIENIVSCVDITVSTKLYIGPTFGPVGPLTIRVNGACLNTIASIGSETAPLAIDAGNLGAA